MLDSLRKDHVGCYGNSWIKTPNLDSLAKQGVVFSNAFPEALPTLPVRRAMHTGMRTFPCSSYQRKKGDTVMIPGWEPIPEHQVTMAEIFRYCGYRTAIFSSTYHMFKPSMNFHRGFDTWEWIRGQEADPYRIPISKEVDIENRAYLPRELAFGCVGHSLHHCLPNMRDWQTEEDWFPARTFGKAIEWLERSRNVEKFLLVVDEFDPHEPWNAPKHMLELYFNTSNYRGRRVINTRGGPYEFRPGELEYTLAQYAGEVTLCDKYVGELVDEIKKLGKLDDTLFIAVADHGHNIMDHGVMHKVPSHLYPELMDLVFIVRHPEREYAGTTCDAYVGHQDILPTILGLAGLSPPVPLDGKNVWEWVTGERTERREYVTTIFGEWIWCRDNEYAYISDLDGKNAKLFDVHTDPKQNDNIASEKPEVCAEMFGRILGDAGGSLPHHDVRRKGHAWYEYPDVSAPNARVPSSDHYKEKG